MKSILRFLLITSIFILFTLPSLSQETILMDNKTINAIVNEVSGEIAYKNEIMLAPFERNRTEAEYTGRFHETKYMLSVMKDYGFQDVHVEEWKYDDRTQWDGVKGELWLVEPEEMKIASYDDIAASFASGSGTADVTGELIFVGEGTSAEDYENVTVKDKIVLATGYIGSVFRLATERGAHGVVCYDASPSVKYPDVVHWRGIRGASGDTPHFGFNVSQRMGGYLAERLRKGEKLKVHAETEAKTYPHKLEVVTGVIPGTDLAADEFLFVAHLFEGIAKQGANDNNSGVACELEAGRAIIELLKKGKISPLRRSIRFLFVPEISGTRAYLERYPEAKEKIKAAINMDMVGESLSRCHTLFWISRTPHSLPHFFNDVCQEFAELTVKMNNDADARYPGNPYGEFAMKVIAPTGSRDLFHLGVTRYEGGSDHIVLVNGDVAIPTVYFECWSEDFYHTSMDTPDKTDPTQLKRVAFIAAASAVTFASARPEDTPTIAAETLSKSEARIAGDLKRAMKEVSKAEPDNLYEAFRNARVIVGQSYERETENLNTLYYLAGDNGTMKNYLDNIISRFKTKKEADIQKIWEHYSALCRINTITARKYELTPEEKEMSTMIVEKTGKPLGRAKVPRTNSIMQSRYASTEALNFIDGNRSILDIAHAVYAEYGGITAPDMKEFIMSYVETGGLRIK